MDKNIYRIIPKFFSHETTEEEEKELFFWLEESEENKRFFSSLIATFSLHESVSASSCQEDTDRMLSRINARIDEEGARVEAPKKRFLIPFIIAAAAAVAALVILFPGTNPGPEREHLTSFANTSSVMKMVTLKDMSRICLKPGSTIRFDVAGLSDRRVLELDGEAYFDVAKDSLRPFWVKTKDVHLKVLGTSFAVRSRKGVQDSEIVLETGSVLLCSPGGTSLVRLIPNQKAVYSSATKDLSVTTVPAMPYVVHHYNMVTMSHATITEIVSRIERSFKVKIHIDVKDDTKRYNLSYLKSDSLKEVLELIECLTGEHCSAESPE